jgi:PAS domain S-box-containing protein
MRQTGPAEAAGPNLLTTTTSLGVVLLSRARDRSAAGLGRVARPAVFDASLWYRTLFAQSALGVTLADGQRRLVDCNDAFCRIVGRSREELLGRRFQEFNVPGDQDVGAAAIEAMIAGAPAFSYEKRYLRADGAKTWVRINLSVLSREQSLYAGIVEDINERKQAEADRALALAQLGDKTDLLARAHEVAKIGTFVVDTRSRTIALSAELATLLAAGAEPFEISVEQYRRTFVHPDDLEWSARLAEAAYLGGEPLSWERRLIRRDGEVIWETSHAGYELDEHGRPLRVIGVVQDITDRVRLIDELRGSRARIVEAGAQERLRLERDLHDGAQNRLVAIQIKLALAREQAGAQAVATRLDEIIDDAEAAIDELRALGHGIYPTELRERGLEGALRSLAEAAPTRVRVIAESVGRHAPTIEEAVFYCVREAIQNATKHAGARAHITLSLKRRDEGVEFEVADDGSGFDPRQQASGFGLTSMRDRIAAVGGDLQTISAPAHGTRIRAIVPHRGAPIG